MKWGSETQVSVRNLGLRPELGGSETQPKTLRPNGATSKLMGNLAPSCCRVFGLCSGQVRDAADAWSRYVRVGVGLRSGLGLLVVGLRSGWGRVAVGLRAHWGRLAFGLGSWCVRAGVG